VDVEVEEEVDMDMDGYSMDMDMEMEMEGFVWLACALLCALCSVPCAALLRGSCSLRLSLLAAGRTRDWCLGKTMENPIP
jgi:hypothetical protein